MAIFHRVCQSGFHKYQESFKMTPRAFKKRLTKEKPERNILKQHVFLITAIREIFLSVVFLQHAINQDALPVSAGAHGAEADSGHFACDASAKDVGGNLAI